MMNHCQRMTIAILVFCAFTLIQKTQGATRNEILHTQILKRVVDHLENFMDAPVEALNRTQRYLQAGGFPNDIDAADRELLLKWMWRELPIYVYFGLEDGFFEYYNDFRTNVPLRQGTLSREPANSGYSTNPVPEDSMKYWMSCIDEYTGAAKNCTLPEGLPYVKCINDCKLELCNTIERDCAELQSQEERNSCEQSIPWCPQYSIATVQPGEQLGTVPGYFSCIDRFGVQSQTQGEVRVGGTYDEPEYGNCYYLDEETMVNRTLEGDYISCGGGNCNPFIGTYLTTEYDPRYRPWYIAARNVQKPMWTEPYPFWTDSSIGISYTEPIYSTEGSQKVFKGVMAVDYTLEEIRLFLSQYKGSSMLVAVVEAADPNYVVATSTGTFASNAVEEKDMTTPCKDAAYPVGCTTIRVPLSSLDATPGDLILQRAFEARAAAGFPTSKLVHFKRSDTMGDQAYIAQGEVFEQSNGASLRWHVVVVMPMQQSPSDAATVGTPSFYIILTVAVVGFVFCIVLFGLFLTFRNQRAVQNADWRFTCAFIFGCAMLNLSSLALLGETGDGLCMLRMWLFNLLFAAALSPLFVKVWRMHKLFHASKNFKRVNVTNFRAMLYTLPIILAELVILFIFSFVDPSRAVEELGVAHLELGLVQTITCQHETQAFSRTQATFHSFLVLLGCYLAFETRNLDPKFGEAKQLAFAMYTIAVTGIILILIFNLVTMDQIVMFLLQATSVTWGTMCSSAAFVAPKLMELERRQNKRKRRSSVHYGRKFVVKGNEQVLVDTDSVALSCWIDVDEKYATESQGEPPDSSSASNKDEDVKQGEQAREQFCDHQDHVMMGSSDLGLSAVDA